MRKKRIAMLSRGLGFLVAGLIVTSAEAVAQRRPLPPNPRDPFPAAASPGDRREERLFLDVRAGFVVPMIDFNDAAGSGPMFGIGVGRWWTESLALQVRAEVDLLGSRTIEEGFNAGSESPSWRAFHVGGSAFYDLTRGDGSLQLGPQIGLGATYLNSGDFPGAEESSWYLAITPGLQVGTMLGRNTSFTIEARYRSLSGRETILNSIVTNLPNEEAKLGELQFQAGFQVLLTPNPRRPLPGGPR